MATTGQIVDIRPTFEAWFEVAIKIQQKKIALLGIKDWGEKRARQGYALSLLESLNYSIQGVGDFSAKGELQYNIYGKFVDMGVGGNYYKGNPGDVPKKGAVQRNRKEWHSRIFYAQVMRFREIMTQKYGKGTADYLVATIQAVKDLKSGAYKK
jgi:hypothetical protein